MKKLFILLLTAFGFFIQTEAQIAVDNNFNALFQIISRSGTNPNFTVRGTLSNPSGKFVPLADSLNVSTDYVQAEYVVGINRFTATFQIDSIYDKSGNTVTLDLTNVSGKTVVNFPTGTHVVVRSTPNKGLLSVANSQTEESRISAINHLINKFEAYVPPAGITVDSSGLRNDSIYLFLSSGDSIFVGHPPDNLGDHVATQDINADGNDVINLADDPYDSGWNGLQDAAAKDDVYDKIESLVLGDIIDSTHIYSDLVYIFFGGDSLLVGYVSIVHSDNSINEVRTLDINNIFSIRDDDNATRLIVSNVGETTAILTKDGNGRFTASDQGVSMGHDDVGYLSISTATDVVEFTENRASGPGLVYNNVKNWNLIDSSLTPKRYVDSLISTVSTNLYVANGSFSSDRTVQLNSNFLQIQDGVNVVFKIDPDIDRIDFFNHNVRFTPEVEYLDTLNVSGRKLQFTEMPIWTNTLDSALVIDPATGNFYVRDWPTAGDNIYTANGVIPGTTTRTVTFGDQTLLKFQGSGGISFLDFYYENSAQDRYLRSYAGYNQFDNNVYFLDKDIRFDTVTTNNSATWWLTWNPSTKMIEKRTAFADTDTHLGNTNLTNTGTRSYNLSDNNLSFWDGENEWLRFDAATDNRIEPLVDINSTADITADDVTITDDTEVGDSLVVLGDIVVPNIATEVSPTKMVTYDEGSKKFEISAISGGGGGGDTYFTDRATSVQVFDEFATNTGIANYYGDLHWLNSATGSATTVWTDDHDADSYGFVRLKGHATNSFSNQLSSLWHNSISDSDWELEVRFRGGYDNFGQAVENAVIGMVRSTYSSGNPTDGVYFFWTGPGSAGTGRTNAAGTTTVNFANDPGNQTWHILRITYDQAAGEVEFFMDGVSQGTSTTNIPTQDDFRFDISYHAPFGSLGVTGANGGILVDYAYFKKTISR